MTPKKKNRNSPILHTTVAPDVRATLKSLSDATGIPQGRIVTEALRARFASMSPEERAKLAAHHGSAANA